jgi:flagella basal body P-ring formation protein FlgA
MRDTARWLLALVALMGAPAGAGTVALELRPQVVLSHPVVTLGDLAGVQADDAGVRRAFERIEVGQAPLVGYVDQRSRADLEMVLRARTLASGQSLVWRGAERVQLRTESQRLDPSAIVEAARRQVLAVHGAAYERIELELASPLPEVLAPAGGVAYRGRLSDVSRLKARTVAWVDVLVAGAVYRSVVVPLTVNAFRRVAVAQRDLAPGDVVGPRAFAVELAEVGALAEAPLAAAELPASGRMRRAVARGQPLSARDLLAPGAVMRGDQVRLVTQAGGIALEAVAFAQADAAPGQKIQVRPQGSRETVTAVVVSSDVVRIDGR